MRRQKLLLPLLNYQNNFGNTFFKKKHLLLCPALCHSHYPKWWPGCFDGFNPLPTKKEKKPERCRTIDQLKLTMIGGGGGGGGGMDAGFLGVLVHSGCCIRFFSASLLENLTPVFFPSERNNHIYQKNSKFLRTPPVTTIVPSPLFAKLITQTSQICCYNITIMSMEQKYIYIIPSILERLVAKLSPISGTILYHFGAIQF